jgi:glucosamine--fructose-6-phosphate aminotransferase (isomerizing)
MQEMLIRLHELKAETVVITDRRNLAPANLAARVISIPGRIPELYSPIPYIIPAQLFAAALAVEKGVDPDRPRALSKITRNL